MRPKYFRLRSAFTIDDRYFPCLHVNWVRAVSEDHWTDLYDEDNRFAILGSLVAQRRIPTARSMDLSQWNSRSTRRHCLRHCCQTASGGQYARYFPVVLSARTTQQSSTEMPRTVSSASA